MKTLRATLAYQNPELVLRIQKSLQVSYAESYRVFADVKSWLWLCARHRHVRDSNDTKSHGGRLPYLAMLDHFTAIDLGWHEFILMTKMYQNFCDEYLDGYIHHLPAAIDSNTLQRKGRTHAKPYLTRFLSFMEEELGSMRLSRWLTGLPKTPESNQGIT